MVPSPSSPVILYLSPSSSTFISKDEEQKLSTPQLRSYLESFATPTASVAGTKESPRSLCSRDGGALSQLHYTAWQTSTGHPPLSEPAGGSKIGRCIPSTKDDTSNAHLHRGWYTCIHRKAVAAAVKHSNLSWVLFLSVITAAAAAAVADWVLLFKTIIRVFDFVEWWTEQQRRCTSVVWDGTTQWSNRGVSTDCTGVISLWVYMGVEGPNQSADHSWCEQTRFWCLLRRTIAGWS